MKLIALTLISLLILTGQAFAVDKQKEVVVSAPHEDVFNVLKAAAPGVFGSKVWTDVQSNGLRTCDGDSSKTCIYFKLEAD